MSLNELERHILKAKGLSDEQLARLADIGIHGKADFVTVGDAGTLAEVAGLSVELAGKVMAWALGLVAPANGPVVVETGDVVYCVHCKARQPKDYESGDLCPACGKQAEPVYACFWCGASGPGKFCRGCGAAYVATGELELAMLLKRDGLPKDEIPKRLAGLTQAEKEALWGRVRKGR